MPNLPAHIDLAHMAARRLDHPALEPYMGYYLLGSTSPDMRAMTKGRREDYHFAPLSFETMGAGAEGLLTTHPHLLPRSGCDGPSRAFVAGYITHLSLDEAWILEMYRPRFGSPDVFEDSDYGKLMDRATQLELDRLSQDGAEMALPMLAEANGRIDVGFISSEMLAPWQAWVLELVGRGFTWDRLRFMARRIAKGDDSHSAHRLADEFLRSMPTSLERLYQYVSAEDLADFRQRSVEQLTRAVGEYLA